MKPWAWYRVVRASQVLTLAEKVVWDDCRILDKKGDGCWMSAKQMGLRLGLSPRTVEEARDRLRRAGLLVAEGRTRMVHYLVRLPPFCEPTGASQNDDVVLALTAELDQRIRAALDADQAQRAIDRLPHSPRRNAEWIPPL